MYKELFRLVIAIVTQPQKAWRELSAREERGEAYLSRFVYPLIGLVTLAAFAGILFTEKNFHTEIALKSAIKALVSSFGGFHLAAYGLNGLWKNHFNREDNLLLCRRFVGYASAPVFALNIVLSVLPLADFFFLRIFILYTVYVVWEGAGPYLHMEESRRLFFVLCASALIILTPEAIRVLLFMLMPGLRV
jgi:hypothetical protein